MTTHRIIKALAHTLYGASRGKTKREIDELVQRACVYLKQKRLLKYTEDLFYELEAHYLKEEHAVSARVYSKHNLTPSQLRTVEEYLSRLTKKKPIITVTLTPEVLGGFLIRCNDIIVDASLKTHVRKLKYHLTHPVL